MENCSTIKITNIKNTVNNLLAMLEAVQNSSYSNKTLDIKSEDLLGITEALALATDMSILTNDTEDVITTVDKIIR